MAAFDALTNLIQTIHDPPQTFVLQSHVSNHSWQVKLFLIASELKCFASAKHEEISRDRKLVAGDKEAAFNDWKTLAEFIRSKILGGDLHVAKWGTSKVEIIIDPGRQSSLTIPVTALDESDATGMVTDLIYLVANDARENRRCALIPPCHPLEDVETPSPSTLRIVKSIRDQPQIDNPSTDEVQQKELTKLKKAELAAKEDELAQEKARPKVENTRPVAVPPKAVAGASTAMPGHARRVIKRAQFSDEEEDEEPPKGKLPAPASKGIGKNPDVASDAAEKGKQRKHPPPHGTRIVKRAEFEDDNDEDEEAALAMQQKPSSSARAAAQAAPTSQTKTKPKSPPPPRKRVIRRADFEDDEDEDEDVPIVKKRRN
ncbi:hypothetical protein DACRYDRAFT_20707 [Dacryopinax primogenitus]|uniref:Uncharacterized protein n=1 Tax=Dacryopinax primogenitus (strain DJM 731) TaxID=1858805 RepID=M5G5P4_DACPD|nr:uncharacterized protein DACRYDRAFT_20707 [Dacryopinax primogenitus]EJU04029.1 hypothetical protein DACRYDRAFT_20707 [Dacryopinax primogenitus]